MNKKCVRLEKGEVKKAGEEGSLMVVGGGRGAIKYQTEWDRRLKTGDGEGHGDDDGNCNTKLLKVRSL